MKRVILTFSAVLVLLSAFAGVGHAAGRELFVLPTEKGLEFYFMDGTLHAPSLEVYRAPGVPWRLHLMDPLKSLIPPLRTFQPSRERLLTLGFRTSLTGRVITVAGQIDWTAGEERLQVAKDSGQKGKTMNDLEDETSSLASYMVIRPKDNSKSR